MPHLPLMVGVLVEFQARLVGLFRLFPARGLLAQQVAQRMLHMPPVVGRLVPGQAIAHCLFSSFPVTLAH